MACRQRIEDVLDARSSNSPLSKFLGKAKGDHGLHAPFRVTSHCGHTVQTFQSLETALEAAEALGPDHYIIDRHGAQIWNAQRKLLRNEE
jgi:hypothetical protein